MGNLKTLVNEKQTLDAAFVKDSEVILNHAGSKRPARIVQINKDRSKAQVSTGSGRPLWYGADCIVAAAPAKHSASKSTAKAATQAKAPKSVKSAKNATTKKAAKVNADEIVNQIAENAIADTQANAMPKQETKVKMTAKQSEFFALVKK